MKNVLFSTVTLLFSLGVVSCHSQLSGLRTNLVLDTSTTNQNKITEKFERQEYSPIKLRFDTNKLSELKGTYNKEAILQNFSLRYGGEKTTLPYVHLFFSNEQSLLHDTELVLSVEGPVSSVKLNNADFFLYLNDSTQGRYHKDYIHGEKSFRGELAPSKPPCNLTYDYLTETNRIYTPGIYDIILDFEPGYYDNGSSIKQSGYWIMCDIVKRTDDKLTS